MSQIVRGRSRKPLIEHSFDEDTQAYNTHTSLEEEHNLTQQQDEQVDRILTQNRLKQAAIEKAQVLISRLDHQNHRLRQQCDHLRLKLTELELELELRHHEGSDNLFKTQPDSSRSQLNSARSMGTVKFAVGKVINQDHPTLLRNSHEQSPNLFSSLANLTSLINFEYLMPNPLPTELVQEIYAEENKNIAQDKANLRQRELQLAQWLNPGLSKWERERSNWKATVLKLTSLVQDYREANEQLRLMLFDYLHSMEESKVHTPEQPTKLIASEDIQKLVSRVRRSMDYRLKKLGAENIELRSILDDLVAQLNFSH